MTHNTWIRALAKFRWPRKMKSPRDVRSSSSTKRSAHQKEDATTSEHIQCYRREYERRIVLHERKVDHVNVQDRWFPVRPLVALLRRRDSISVRIRSSGREECQGIFMRRILIAECFPSDSTWSESRRRAMKEDCGTFRLTVCAGR